LSENPFLEEIYEEVESEVEAGPSQEEERNNVESSDDGELSVENLTNSASTTILREEQRRRDLAISAQTSRKNLHTSFLYSQKPDLYSHLLWQLRLCSADDNVRRSAEVVIGILTTTATCGH